MPLLHTLNQVPQGIRAYLDDTTLLGKMTFQSTALGLLSSSFQQYGLTVNYRKFHVLLGRRSTLNEAQTAQRDYSLLCPGIPIDNIQIHPDNLHSSNTSYGCIVLGIPVGNDPFVLQYLSNFFSNSLLPELHRLRKVTQFHSLWTYLSYVVNHKITHFLRAIPPSLTSALVQAFSTLQLQYFDRVTQLDLPSELHCQEPPYRFYISTSCAYLRHQGVSI